MNSLRYDYSWNVFYIPEKHIKVRGGTTLHSRAVYDNSSGNTLNPDPTVDVPSGLGIFGK